MLTQLGIILFLICTAGFVFSITGLLINLLNQQCQLRNGNVKMASKYLSKAYTFAFGMFTFYIAMNICSLFCKK